MHSRHNIFTLNDLTIDYTYQHFYKNKNKYVYVFFYKYNLVLNNC